MVIIKDSSMGRFSDTLKTGYNKEVIEKAKLKNGDNITIRALYTNDSTFWSLESDGITAAQDSSRKYPKRFVFDDSALGPAHTELLKDIHGIAPEVITLYSCNPEIYEKYESVYEELLSSIIEAGASIKTIGELARISASHTPVLIELKHPIENFAEHHDSIDTPWGYYAHGERTDPILRKLENYSLLGYLDNNPPFLSNAQHITVSTDKMLRDVKTELAEKYPILSYFCAPDDEIYIATQHIRKIYSLAAVADFNAVTEARTARKNLINALLEAGAKPVKPVYEHDDLTTETGPLLVLLESDPEKTDSHYGYFGLVTAHDVYSGSITFGCSIPFKKTFDALSQQHESIAKFAAYDSVDIDESEIAAVYTLADIKLTAEPVPSDAQTIEALYPAAQWAVSASALNNDMLPNMTGFEPTMIGGGAHTWCSPVFLLADRDLKPGECVKAWVISEHDGRILKTVSSQATTDDNILESWPKVFLSTLNATLAVADGNQWMCAGYLADSGGMAIADTVLRTTDFLRLESSEKHRLNRLWYYADNCRLFTNAPFTANQVIACNLPDYPPAEGDTVSVQVRDRTTLRLYETHLYSIATDNAASSTWINGFCDFINKQHLNANSQYGMLRAGALAEDGVTLTAAPSGNSLWIPQQSNLSVELDALSFRKHRAVSAFTPVAGQEIKFHMLDQYSSTQLPGSPLSFTVPQGESDAQACLLSLAETLQTSALGDCLRLGDAYSHKGKPDSADGWWLWLLPLPARFIVEGLPSLGGTYEPALETLAGQKLTLQQLYQDYKQGLTLALTDRWNEQTVSTWMFTADSEQTQSLAQWVRGLALQLGSQFVRWGTLDALHPQPVIDAMDLSNHTLWLPKALESVLIVGQIEKEPTPAARCLPDLYPEFTFVRDYFQWEEAEEYARLKEEERAYVTSYHTHFSSMIAFGDEPLTERDRKEVNRREARERFTRELMKRPDFDFYIPSANVPALVASKLSRGNEPYPQKDVWQLRTNSQPPHYSWRESRGTSYWTECVSSNDYQMTIAFARPNPDYFPIAAALKLLSLASNNRLHTRHLIQAREHTPDLANILHAFKDASLLTAEADLVLECLDALAKKQITPPARDENFSEFPEYLIIDRADFSVEDLSLSDLSDNIRDADTNDATATPEGNECSRELIAGLLATPGIAEICKLLDEAALVSRLGRIDEVNAEYLHLQLTASAVKKGIRFISYTSDFAPDLLVDANAPNGGFRLYIPRSSDIRPNEVICSASSVSRTGIVPTRRSLTPEGRRVGQAPFMIQKPYTGRDFKPKDTLCADYANTVGSEVYDVSGASENGVDAKTGLFHAHYSVAVIRGLSGNGPEIELNLHYCATRANESALGDGWAFRFSAWDNRLHKLTLYTGQTITLTADHIDKAKGNKRLAINGVTLTGATGSFASLTALTVIYPSGRQETLTRPALHDGQEASKDYKDALLLKVRKIKENLQKWLRESGLSTEQSSNFQSKLDEIGKLESEMDRKAFILTPSQISAPQGSTLTLSWEGRKGHVHLHSIAEGSIQLLTAVHEPPTATGTYTSQFTVWPDTDEAYTVSLTIEDCLLIQLKRQGLRDASPVQSVVFGYEGEAVLDRVLCSVAEDDGSLEYVSYAPMWKDWDVSNSIIPLSRVVRHTLLPGAGQRPITYIWEWDGNTSVLAMKEGDTFSGTRSLETGTHHHGPSTRRTWTLTNGFLVETQTVETTPGLARETTTHTYPEAITSTDPAVIYRLATQPVSTTVTFEDLRAQVLNDRNAKSVTPESQS